MTDAEAELRELLERNPELAALNPEAAKRLGISVEQASVSDEDRILHSADMERRQSGPAARPSENHAERQHPEADFQKAVIDYAHLKGWHVAAVRHARTVDGWRTPWQADGNGMKDLILVRERVVWAELKVGKNVCSEDQLDWDTWLRNAGQKSYIWYPIAWPEIEEVLR